MAAGRNTGDITTLEDGASVDEVKKAIESLKTARSETPG